MKLILLSDKDFNKIINDLDDVMFEHVSKKIKESVISSSDIEMIQISKEWYETFQEFKTTFGYDTETAIETLIDAYYSGYD